MENPTIVLACRNDEATRVLFDGQTVSLSGFTLELRQQDNIAKMCADMVAGQFDVSEMSFSEYVYALSRGETDFIGIPVFPLRTFRHETIFCRRDANIRSPRDIEGKRFGTQRWVQTCAVWVHGMLTEHYGVSPEKTDWYVPSLHHWDIQGDELPATRDKSLIRLMTPLGSDQAETLHMALNQRLLEAVGITGRVPLFKNDSGLVLLFPDPAKAAREYLEKTGIFPIMHVLVVRKSIVEQYPALPKALFDFFCAAKASSGARTIWTYGFEQNLHVIETFLDYCFLQGISGRQIKPQELFLSETLRLSE